MPFYVAIKYGEPTGQKAKKYRRSFSGIPDLCNKSWKAFRKKFSDIRAIVPGSWSLSGSP